jgi:hypothetical protein
MDAVILRLASASRFLIGSLFFFLMNIIVLIFVFINRF